MSCAIFSRVAGKILLLWAAASVLGKEELLGPEGAHEQQNVALLLKRRYRLKLGYLVTVALGTRYQEARVPTRAVDQGVPRW